MQHSFDTEIAAKYGIVEAILLNNFVFWLAKKRANNQDFHDGRYWTYNSVRAYAELFPYLTEKQVRRALNKLLEEGLVVTANYNEKAYDRKLWYSLTEKAMNELGVDLRPKKANGLAQKGECICPKGQMDLPKKANGFAQKGEPIADINTDINTDINSSSSSSSNNNINTTERKQEKTTATAAKDVIAFWISNTGQYGEVLRTDISEMTELYGSEFVKEAMREAIRSNVRNIKYVKKIVERMASGAERPTKDAPKAGSAWSAAFEKLYGGGVENGNNQTE